MQAIAKFVMRDRTNAIVAVVLGVISPFGVWINPVLAILIPLGIYLSSATSALVMLRYGVKEYCVVISLGFVLGLFWLIYEGSSILWILLGSGLLAYVLRSYANWQPVVIYSALLGCVVAVLIYFTQFQLLELTVKYFTESNSLKFKQKSLAENQNYLLMIILGLMSLIVQLCAITSTMLARYWQACLYNKGGFGGEFRTLILPYKVALIFFAVVVIEWCFRVVYGSSQYSALVLLIYIPLILSSLALMHYLVFIRRLNSSLLVVGYMCIFTPLNIGICALAFLDSLINIRSRLDVV